MNSKTIPLTLITSVLALGGCHNGGNAGSQPEPHAAGGGSPVAGATSTGGWGGETGPTSGGNTSGGASSSVAGASGSANCGSHEGFWVDGRTLRDRCCEEVVLRGVSEMVVWSTMQDGSPYFEEIAKTGANVVRIIWSTTATPTKLDAAIKNAIDAHLIPMPELHDATGDMTKLASCIDYWVQPDVVAVLKKYADKLLVNIANEPGNGSVVKADWVAAYSSGIERMRAAGIHVPLIVDAPAWGQDINMLQAAGPDLTAADPDKNLMFSVHMWWNDPAGTRITSELNESVTMGLPLIVGEFAQHNFSGCSTQGLAYKTLLELAQSNRIGWLAWSWGGVKNNDCANDQPFDMTTDGTFAGLAGWGLEVATTDPNSIAKTSVRPHYLVNGSCN